MLLSRQHHPTDWATISSFSPTLLTISYNTMLAQATVWKESQGCEEKHLRGGFFNTGEAKQ